MTDQSLLPCPFCGSPAESMNYFKDYAVECTNIGKCPAYRLTAAGVNRVEAAKKWNTRHPQPDAGMRWQDISTAPKEDGSVFLVNRHCSNDGRIVEQVEVFEGQMYPSYLGDCIDWDDRVLNATHWAKLLPLPSAQPPATGDDYRKCVEDGKRDK